MLLPAPRAVSADYRSQLLNEIMPMIYKRFTEKAAEEWRQIYKVRDLGWDVVDTCVDGTLESSIAGIPH